MTSDNVSSFENDVFEFNINDSNNVATDTNIHETSHSPSFHDCAKAHDNAPMSNEYDNDRDNNVNISHSLSHDNDITSNLFGNMQNLRKNYLNHIMIGHLNVNSLGSKLTEIKELQNLCKIDVLVLSETKLDGSYKQEVLDIDGYSCIRQDKRSNSGGLLMYISNDIHQKTTTI